MGEAGTTEGSVGRWITSQGAQTIDLRVFFHFILSLLFYFIGTPCPWFLILPLISKYFPRPNWFHPKVHAL